SACFSDVRNQPLASTPVGFSSSSRSSKLVDVIAICGPVPCSGPNTTYLPSQAFNFKDTRVRPFCFQYTEDFRLPSAGSHSSGFPCAASDNTICRSSPESFATQY